MIIDIGKDTIDLCKVERVGGIGGDSSWLRYTIFFVSGNSMDVYQERKEGRQMKREDFIKIWKRSFIDG